MFKLVDSDGSILGAVVLERPGLDRALREQISVTFPFLEWPQGYLSQERVLPDTVDVKHITLMRAPMRGDAVMIVQGTLWDFEKCEGCFFIPGYAYSQKPK